MTKKVFLFLIFNALLFSSTGFSKQSELKLTESSDLIKKTSKKPTGDKAKNVRSDRKSTAKTTAGKVDSNRDERARKTVRGAKYLNDKNDEETQDSQYCPSSCVCTCPAE